MNKKKHSEETRKRMSEARRQWWAKKRQPWYKKAVAYIPGMILALINSDIVRKYL